MNINNLCMGCMKEKPTLDGVCPFCGFDETRQEVALHHLPPRTILAAKLLIGRVLGEGGFGITYIGYDLNLSLPVAIKEFYPSGFASRESSVSVTVSAFQGKMGDVFNDGKSKFVEEARRLARFRNLPGIVAVNDFIMENGTAYIVMEYIEGITLKAHLARIGGRMHTDEVLSLMRPVMESLSKMHEADLIHRDISPDNIMISTMGEIRLIDFGAARSFAGDVNKSLSILLKPGYAPIEQYSSKGTQGPFTDVYAICATIYKAITGETPTESSDRVSEDIVTPPSGLGADIDPHREQVLLKGMALLAKNRYQTIGELMGELYSEAMPTVAPQNVYRPSVPVEEPKAISQSEPPSEPRSISQLQPTPQPAPQPTPQRSAPPQPTAAPKNKLNPILPLIAVGVVFLVLIVNLVMQNNLTPPEELFSNNNFTSQEEGFEADEQPTDDSPENVTTDGASFEITPEEGAELIMGTNAAFPPYEYIENGELVGIDIEIAVAIAEKLGMELEIHDMEFDAIIPSLQTGKTNIGLAGLTVTPEREQSVDFTESYATNVQVIIVDEDSSVTSIDDLFADDANHTIGVQHNTTGDLYTTWDFEDTGLATIDRYNHAADAIQALVTGKVDCVVIDNEPAKAFVAANEGLSILDTRYIEEQYAIAMSKDNEELYNKVNTALQELKADGTLDAIVTKYIPA